MSEDNEIRLVMDSDASDVLLVVNVYVYSPAPLA